MFTSLAASQQHFLQWKWADLEPYFQDLKERTLVASNLDEWLSDWSDLRRIVSEISQRLYVGVTVNTVDEEASLRYSRYLDEIFPAVQSANQLLNKNLLDSGLQPTGFDIALRNIKAEASLFQADNLPLLAEELKLANHYDKISGSQTIIWEGRETTIAQLKPVYQETDRSVREKAWNLSSQRQLADRESLNQLWIQFMDVRKQLAANAGKPDYRAYRWQQLLRFDYTPQDCELFHRAIEEVVVPVASHIYEKRRRRLGINVLRPWDLEVDTLGRPPLKPFSQINELVEKTETIFRNTDPQLGEYFAAMRSENLLDLDNRKNKAPGGYCTSFDYARKPFIFMNSVGLHEDVLTLLHEGGHAFHVYESAVLPYHHQLEVGMEFGEVASTAMELLAIPYLETSQGGFYKPEEAARVCIEHLENMILFWPYMAVVDAFQQWVYTHHSQASDPANCDKKWRALWDRFMVGVDWTGLDDALETGWQRKLHIFEVPFYYIEYGLAQSGALQVWRNALRDQAGTVAAYRKALALGGTVSLPELYETAGAKFAFDTEVLRTVMELALTKIESLEGVTWNM